MNNITIEDYKQVFSYFSSQYPNLLNADGSLKLSIANLQRHSLKQKLATEIDNFEIGNKYFRVVSSVSVQRYKYLQKYLLEVQANGDIDSLKEFIDYVLAKGEMTVTKVTINSFADLILKARNYKQKVAQVDSKVYVDAFIKIATLFIVEENENLAEFDDNICNNKIAVFNQAINYDIKYNYNFFLSMAMRALAIFQDNYAQAVQNFTPQTKTKARN